MISYRNHNPKVDASVFIAENAVIIGQVTVEADANIWFGTVIRGDINSIHIGKETNIQDNSTIHVGYKEPTVIGNQVTVGHNCIIHGCTIGHNSLIGMGSTILNGAKIGRNSIVGANSLVTMHKVFPDGVLIMGSPAKVIRDLSGEEIMGLGKSATNYVALAKEYK